ncbi:unnamed protein product, partial [Choristocarpus tenellus]
KITSCFEKIACFALTHPGFHVVKKTYDGDIFKIEGNFKRLLNAYVRHIFGDLLEPKRIRGRFLTAPELRNYVASYVKLFQDGAKFPAATTLLEATAIAHNGNARHVGLTKYKSEMDHVLGPSAVGFLPPQAFAGKHVESLQGALGVFDGMATMGRRDEIARIRVLLRGDIDSEKER